MCLVLSVLSSFLSSASPGSSCSLCWRCSSLASTVDLQGLLPLLLAHPWGSGLRTIFLSCSTKALLILGLCSLLMSYLGLICFLGPVAVSFSLMCGVSKWWSLPTTAPFLTLKSSSERHHMPFTMGWSIWFWSQAFREVQVSLWMLRCRNIAPPMTMLSFCTPHPSFHITISQFTFSEPTLAFRSPITSSMSLRWASSKAACSCL